MMDDLSKIYVAGHNGLVGSALCNCLYRHKFRNVIVRRSSELNLRCSASVDQYFAWEKPEYVFLAAGKVGGILANSTYPADFIYDNIMIAANVIHAAHKYKVKKLLYTGSSCIYPKLAEQPMKEEALLSGSLEPTNEAYAIAKIAGIKLCQAYNKQHGDNFISVMPTNLYGPRDNYDLESSHVLPALIRKVHEAKVKGSDSVKVWGSGQVKREFLYSEDLAEALLTLMQYYDDPDIVNIGTGKDLSIEELCNLIKEVVGYEGDIVYDTSKPDGTPRKLLDISRLRSIGWEASTSLKKGVAKTYDWFVNNFKDF